MKMSTTGVTCGRAWARAPPRIENRLSVNRQHVWACIYGNVAKFICDGRIAPTRGWADMGGKQVWARMLNNWKVGLKLELRPWKHIYWSGLRLISTIDEQRTCSTTHKQSAHLDKGAGWSNRRSGMSPPRQARRRYWARLGSAHGRLPHGVVLGCVEVHVRVMHGCAHPPNTKRCKLYILCYISVESWQNVVRSSMGEHPPVYGTPVERGSRSCKNSHV